MALDPFAPDEGLTAGIPRLPEAVKDILPPPMDEYLPGEPGFEHEVERAVPVCRWCKGKREITINFKTKPCDCVKQEDTDTTQSAQLNEQVLNEHYTRHFGVGVGWKIKKSFVVG